MGTKTTAQELSNLAQKPAGLQVNQASREKYWKELNADEKIERLRALLKSQVSENDKLRREIYRMKTHTHNSEGKAVITTPLTEYYGEELVRGSNQFGIAYPGAKEDEVYI